MWLRKPLIGVAASFYLNEKNNVVINFDEGDVAPMYMGSVEFEISSEVLSNIRK